MRCVRNYVRTRHGGTRTYTRLHDFYGPVQLRYRRQTLPTSIERVLHCTTPTGLDNNGIVDEASPLNPATYKSTSKTWVTRTRGGFVRRVDGVPGKRATGRADGRTVGRAGSRAIGRTVGQAAPRTSERLDILGTCFYVGSMRGRNPPAPPFTAANHHRQQASFS